MSFAIGSAVGHRKKPRPRRDTEAALRDACRTARGSNTFKRAHHRVVILGSGLAGTGVALSLAARGMPVALLDQDSIPLNRASLRNEGKIHLGLIYANDSTLPTAQLQLKGALRFRSLLKRWIGVRADLLSRSTAFLYLVATGSLLSADQLNDHYRAVEKSYRDLIRADPALDYLGERPESLFQPCSLSTLAGVLNTSRFVAAYHTAERAIDTEELARSLRRAVSESPDVTFLPRHKVVGVTPAPMADSY